jgi:hypothetical protein
MAADVFFDDNHVWSTSLALFEEILDRAVDACRDEDAWLRDILSLAGATGCLSVDQHEDARVRVRLAISLLSAANEHVEVLRVHPGIRSGELQSVQQLITITRDYLSANGDR